MKYIKQVITILGISTLLGGIPAAVYAQVPLPRVEKSPIDKTSLQQFYNQGVQKLAQGNFNGAVEDFDKVLQLNPRYYEGYCLRGLAKAQLQDYASGGQRLIHTQDNKTCITNPHGHHNFICIRDSERSPGAKPVTTQTIVQAKSDVNVAMLDFTEEESDAAINLFGCDCPYCLNSLRQLKGDGSLVY